MSINDFTIDYLARSLLYRLDRNNIFPPVYNNPELFLSSVVDRSIFIRPKRPANAFLLCRRNVQEETKRQGSYINMRIISKAASILWNNASLTEKIVYRNLYKRVYEIRNKR